MECWVLWSVGYGVLGTMECWVWGVEYGVLGIGCWVWNVGYRVWDFGYGVLSMEC